MDERLTTLCIVQNISVFHSDKGVKEGKKLGQNVQTSGCTDPDSKPPEDRSQ